MKFEEIQIRIEAALEQLLPIRGQLEGDFSTDLAFAIGALAGQCVRVKELLEKDRHDRRAD